MTAPHRNIYRLAKELGRPVARGELPHTQALAALLNDTLRQERAGTLGALAARDVMAHKRFVLEGEVHRLSAAREMAEYRITRLVRPMMALRKPRNEILAEAHGYNGGAGFPLAENEVSDIVLTLVHQSQRMRRYG